MAAVPAPTKMIGAVPLNYSSTPAPSQAQAAGQAFRAANWYNGGTTATPTTESQNLANVVNQPGNTVAQNPTPYIQGVLGQAAQVPKPQGTFNPPGSAGDGNSAPMGSVPPPSAPSAPKFDAAGIAASRVAAQRAAVAASSAAFDKSRTDAFNYTTKNMQDQRVLDAAMFHEQNNPFSGKYQYDKTNILRNNGIQDTQNQMQYNNEIAASDAKLAAFDAGSAGLQQDLQQQLEHQNLQDNIAQAGVTGQYNGSPTLAAQGQQFNQGIAQAGVTGQYNGSPTLAANQQGFQDRLAYGNATGTFDNGQHTLAAVTSMAQLTGKMPDGSPTNAAQQQQLQNQWTVAEQTGTIPNSLADFYGLPHGMQTQAAKTQAAQIAISSRNSDISQQNADNSARSTTASINNMNADNARADNAVKLSADGRAAQGTILGDLSKLTANPATAEANINAYFSANADHFGSIIGADAYNKMKQDALAPYQKVTQADKQDQSVRDKAIAAAQKDFRWDAKGTDKNALIKEYEDYYK